MLEAIKEAIVIMDLGPMLLKSLIAAIGIVLVTGVAITIVMKTLEKTGIISKTRWES